MSIGIRLAPRCSESAIKQMVEDAGAVYESPEKRKRKERPEDKLHFAVAKYLRAAIGREGITHGATCWWSYELRNASRITTRSGKSISVEGAARKARGCIAGLPDVSVLHNGRLHGIELKADGGTTSEAQRALHGAWRAAGAPVALARSLDDVAQALAAWGVPLRATL